MTTGPSADDDRATFRKLTDEMAAIHMGGSAPGKAPEFLTSVRSGSGLMALLAQRFNPDVGINETMHALEPVHDSAGDDDLRYYMKLLHEASQKLGLKPEQLEALYQRNKDRQMKLSA